MALTWPAKDPDEVLDYQLDWSARLPEGDTISTSTWIVPDGLTQGATSNDSSSTTLWLSEGVEGEAYTVTNRITTAGGRTMDQSVKIKVKSK